MPSRPRAVDVLLVENDPLIRRLLAEALRFALPGIRIEVALDGLEAVERLEQGCRPKLILTNVVLPHVDGELLLAWVRTALPDTPVIAVSAVSTRASFDDFLDLPMDLDTLSERLRPLLPALPVVRHFGWRWSEQRARRLTVRRRCAAQHAEMADDAFLG